MSQTRATTGTPTDWLKASEALAARVTRRAALGRFLTPLGCGLAVGGALAVAMPLIPPGLPPWLGVLLGGTAGATYGLLRAARTPAHQAGPAAWALDRLGEADGRGLTAAMVEGARASEAAFAKPMLAPPPRLRLLPPRGVLPAAAGCLAALLGVVVGLRLAEPEEVAPPPHHARTGERAPGERTARRMPGGRDAASVEQAAPDATALEMDVAAMEADVSAEARALRALGLDPEIRPTRASLEAQLANEARRAQATQAAADDPALREALASAGDDPTAAIEALRRVAQVHAEAERLRREAVAARSPLPQRVLPQTKRSLVARYQARRHARQDAGDREMATEKERAR